MVASVSLLIDLTSRFLFRIPNPPIIYLLAVVYASFRFGLAGGLAGTAISVMYATQFLSIPGQPFMYTQDNLGRLIVLVSVTPLMAIMVGRLRQESDRRLAAMQELSDVDALTGVANRRAFTRDGERDLLRAYRMAIPIGVIAIDIDHFKRINDTYGHATGDVVLRVAAQRIRQATRDVDTVARVGGEEFAVLLPGADDQTASLAAERIRTLLTATPVSTGHGDMHVTASFGVTVALPGDSLASSMARADMALYEAKRTGRDRVVVAVPVAGATGPIGGTDMTGPTDAAPEHRALPGAPASPVHRRGSRREGAIAGSGDA